MRQRRRKTARADPAPMVKSLLTRIAYPPSLKACVGPPLAAVRAISSQCRGISGCLGHIRATLLSAQEAKDRLREIVEGFFFRRLRAGDARRVGRLLVKSPPGLGKTRETIHWAMCYQAEQEGKDGTRLLVGDFNEAGVPAQTSIFVPRHQ